jgi:hypothetical protein
LNDLFGRGLSDPSANSSRYDRIATERFRNPTGDRQVIAMPKINRDGDEVHGSGPSLLLTQGSELPLLLTQGSGLPLRLTNGYSSTLSRLSASLLIAVSVAGLAPASAQPFTSAGGPTSWPFTATLSNTTPLAFGLDVDATSRALGTPLKYISGRPGNEVYLAFRHSGGSGLFFHNHRLFLQFRKGKLAGWKGDWGHNWMWQ